MRTRGLVAVGLILGLLAACGSDGAERDASGGITKAGDVSVFGLQAGDCLHAPDGIEAELRDVRGVPCEEPHSLEVFAVVPYDEGDTYPGEDGLGEFAQGACVDQFDDYVGIDYVDSSLFLTYLLPSLRSWDERDDRDVVCVVTTTGEQLEASVEGSQR